MGKSEIVVFNDEESDLLDRCQRAVRKRGLEDSYNRINKNVDALVELSRAISQYPSILTSTDCGVNMRSVDTLIEMLSQNTEFDKMLHVPTKAVLGKGFLVAKINFFHMLRYLSNPMPELRNESIEITNVITDIIYTMMSEEVFITLIEDKNINEDVRMRSAFLLANIWEYRLNTKLDQLAPILNSIWEARNRLEPVFGTMMGTIEVMTLSSELDRRWIDFLTDPSSQENVSFALEEFLFTLSYEELGEIRDRMSAQSLKCITKKDIPTMLGRRPIYPEFGDKDPRDMYRFYRMRKGNAKFRRRADRTGPKRTIEEYIVEHLISMPEWAAHL